MFKWLANLFKKPEPDPMEKYRGKIEYWPNGNIRSVKLFDIRSWLKDKYNYTHDHEFVRKMMKLKDKDYVNGVAIISVINDDGKPIEIRVLKSKKKFPL